MIYLCHYKNKNMFQSHKIIQFITYVLRKFLMETRLITVPAFPDKEFWTALEWVYRALCGMRYSSDSPPQVMKSFSCWVCVSNNRYQHIKFYLKEAGLISIIRVCAGSAMGMTLVRACCSGKQPSCQVRQLHASLYISMTFFSITMLPMALSFGSKLQKSESHNTPVIQPCPCALY